MSVLPHGCEAGGILYSNGFHINEKSRYPRNSLARPEIEAIMAQQASRAQRLAHADVVIYNDGLDLDQLQTAVHDMLARFGL